MSPSSPNLSEGISFPIWQGAPVTFMAICHSLLLSCLNICYPQVVVINEWEEGRVSRADLGIHSWPCALSLDFQRLHWRHLQQETHKQLCTKPASLVMFKRPKPQKQYSTWNDGKHSPDKRNDHHQTDADVQPSPTKTIKSISGDTHTNHYQTHHETILAPISTMKEAVAGLEEE